MYCTTIAHTSNLGTSDNNRGQSNLESKSQNNPRVGYQKLQTANRTQVMNFFGLLWYMEVLRDWLAAEYREDGPKSIYTRGSCSLVGKEFRESLYLYAE